MPVSRKSRRNGCWLLASWACQAGFVPDCKAIFVPLGREGGGSCIPLERKNVEGVASEKTVAGTCPPGGSALLEVQRRSVLGYLFVRL